MLLSKLAFGHHVDVTTPASPSTALLSVISKIEAPTVQDFFMLHWFTGRQWSAGVARTGIANIFSCITSCSLVILQSSREPACFTRTVSQRQIGC